MNREELDELVNGLGGFPNPEELAKEICTFDNSLNVGTEKKWLLKNGWEPISDLQKIWHKKKDNNV